VDANSNKLRCAIVGLVQKISWANKPHRSRDRARGLLHPGL
jgi:hypothetical protein